MDLFKWYYLTSISGRSEAEPRGSNSSASSSAVSRLVEKGNFSIATAAPIVIPSITKQEIISAEWMSYLLAMSTQELGGNETPNCTGRNQSDTFAGLTSNNPNLSCNHSPLKCWFGLRRNSRYQCPIIHQRWYWPRVYLPRRIGQRLKIEWMEMQSSVFEEIWGCLPLNTPSLFDWLNTFKTRKSCLRIR